MKSHHPPSTTLLVTTMHFTALLAVIVALAMPLTQFEGELEPILSLAMVI